MNCTYNGIPSLNVRFYVWRLTIQNVAGMVPVTPNWNQIFFLNPPSVFDFATERFIVPHTGLYNFVGGADIILAAAGSVYLDYNINGTTYTISSETTSIAKTLYVNHSSNFWLNKGDFVQYSIYQDSGLNATIGNSNRTTFFSGTSVYLQGK